MAARTTVLAYQLDLNGFDIIGLKMQTCLDCIPCFARQALDAARTTVLVYQLDLNGFDIIGLKMQICLDCIPCFARQALDAARMATNNVQKQEQIVRQVLEMVSNIDLKISPPAMAQQIHRKIKSIVKIDDPYKEKKEHFNEFALGLFSKFKALIANSEKPLETAIRLAIAGNIIDLGAKSSISTDEAQDVINNSLTDPFDASEIDLFKSAISKAKDILYLGDNAGEIVFDKFLIWQIGADKITFVVKGSPILNDATMEDAKAAGITNIVRVIDNGDDAPGTILESCSKEFRDRFEKADLIISKGQGNYETLNDVDKNIFFILKAKCHVVAEQLDCEIGTMILRSTASATKREKKAV